MSTLIIPMLVEAYASGNTRTTQKDVPLMAPNYKTALATSVLGSQNTPGANAMTSPLEAGVHLHFILPDAFTHSSDEENFPVVPNRYIVTRVWRDSSDKLSTKCFTVESDYISRDSSYNSSITIPFFSDPDDRKKWRYLGRSYPADNVPPAGDKKEYLDKLTALGAGDPFFSAYYPSCKSVFGFHDDLKDLPIAPSIKLTYFVMGYFSDSGDDPFSKVKTAADFQEVLNSLNLSVGGSSELCNSSMLYGAIDAIEWKGFEADYCPSPEGKVNVVSANTSAEALSFAIKESLGRETALSERMLTALQYELYDENDKFDGNFKIDDEIHTRSFSSFNGFDENCHITVDKNCTLDSEDNMGQEYSEIVKLGGEVGALQRSLDFEQKKLFAIWEQYVLLYEEEESRLVHADYPPKASMLEEIMVICGKIKDISNNLREKSEEYRIKMEEFSAALPEGVTCEKSGNQAFYTAKDPVLLLSGPGINRTFAFGEDGRFTGNGTLMCQTRVVVSNIGKEEIFEKCFAPLNYFKGLPSMYTDLLLQTALICADTFAAIKSRLSQISVLGEKPSEIAVNRDPFNWTTLYMIWGAGYRPTRTNANLDNTLSDWKLEYGETNLVYKGNLKPEQLKEYKISGKIILTPHAVKTLSSVVNRYADIYGDEEEIKELADKIKDFPIISQNLSGFSEYFSGFRQALQFPIFGIGEADEITRMVTDSIGRERLSILPDSSLMPLRGGYLKITDLMLVSSFGQTQKLVQSSYYSSCEVDFAETINCNIKDYGLLPPSFTVPARLNADYVSMVSDDILTSVAPETSPLCGILIPEMLNRRLLAYDADGTYLGMIKTVYRNGKPMARWLSAPNLSADFNHIPISNEYLSSFLKTLFSGENAFYEFNGLMDRYLDNKQNFGTLVWGRPLVLARFKLNFEFFSSPQFSKRFEDFKKYDTSKAEEIRFDLGFGDMERVTDGLLGCFDDSDFTKMFPPFGAKNPYKIEKFIQYSQGLDISNTDGDRFFTLLLEPNSPINIQTGILPVKTVHFEPIHSKPLENLSLSAEISPVLAAWGQVGIPSLPETEENYSYKWYALDKEKYKGSKIMPPIVSFDETILMDGLIVKEAD